MVKTVPTLVRQTILKTSVTPSSQYSEKDDHQNGKKSGPQKREHGSGTSTRECPAQAENDTSISVAFEAFLFVCKDDGFSKDGFQLETFNELNDNNSKNQSYILL